MDVIDVTPEWTYVSFEGNRGFVPTSVLQGPDGETLRPREAAPAASLVPSLNTFGTVALDYEAELKEGLSCPARAQVRVIQAGEEWSFCEYRGNKGFVPSSLISVSAESLLEYCRRQDLPVAPAASATSDGSSEGASSLKKPFVFERSLQNHLEGTTVARVPEDAEHAISAFAWKALSVTEQHRQKMIYGIIYSEFVYNKNLWALSQVARDFSAMNETQSMLTAAETDALFADVSALYALSNTLFGQMMRKVTAAKNGVVDSIIDVLEANLYSFEIYASYCGKERRVVQQHVFLEYSGLFGHPFQRFIQKMDAQIDLPQLVGKPAQYISQWPFYLNNLLKNTSHRTQPHEYSGIRALQAEFTSLNLQLLRASATAAANFKQRIVNYNKIAPHLRGQRLLKESPARIVAASGADYGNQAFLFDTCIVFARTLDENEKASTGGVFRALKKVKLSGLRIVDVKKSTLIVRSEGDRYYMSFPTSVTAVDWRNLVSHKNYREQLDASDYDTDDLNLVTVPHARPEYDAHMARVQRMHTYIAGLLGPNAPALAPVSNAGRETLQKTANGPSSRSKATLATLSPEPAVTGGEMKAVADVHPYSDSGESTSSEQQKHEPNVAKSVNSTTYDPRTASKILNDAMETPARKRSSIRPGYSEDLEEDESGSAASGGAGKRKSAAMRTPGGAVIAASAKLDSTSEFWEDEDEEEYSYYEGESSEKVQTKSPSSAPQTASPVSVAVPQNTPAIKTSTVSAAVPADESSQGSWEESDFMTTSSEGGAGVGKKKAQPGPSSMYRTLTGTLENIIKSTAGSAGRSESDEWETELSSEVHKSVKASGPVPSTATPVARPTAAVFSNSPDASPAGGNSGTGSATGSGKATARRPEEEDVGEDEDEWEYEDEDESTAQ